MVFITKVAAFVIFLFHGVMLKCLKDILGVRCIANIVKDISRIVREVKKIEAGPLKLKKAEGNTQRRGKGLSRNYCCIISIHINLKKM